MSINKNQLPNGVWPVMVTPFYNDGSIDYKSLERLVDWYVSQNVDGLFAVCQSSEMFYLSLEEKIEIAKATVRFARGRVPVIASGHTSDSMELQVKELSLMAETGVKAVVLITNRLAAENEPDSVFIKNIEYLTSQLSSEISLGFYECPYPYKRLISPEVLRYCIDSGRFSFLKDTCCDSSLIRDRLNLMKGSQFKLFNANSATLSLSLAYGANGYSGVMANFHPALYKDLILKQLSETLSGDSLQNFLGPLSSVEDSYYPMSAKYHLKELGIFESVFTRKPGPSQLDENHIRIVEQLAALTSVK